MPSQETTLSQFYNRRRRRQLVNTGGLAPGVADHVFEGGGTLLAPSPALTAGQVSAPATFVARTTNQAATAVSNTAFLNTASTFGLGFTIATGVISILAPGFGTVTGIDSPIPVTSGEMIFLLIADIPNTRLALYVNGQLTFDDTNVGFTSWGSAADTYTFGTAPEDTIYHSFEIYLGRLPAGR